jgi:outer membrane protein assembly factor BamB
MNAGYYSLPVISSDEKYMYINTYNKVYCIDATDGTTVGTPFIKVVGAAKPSGNSFPVIANPVIDYTRNYLYAAGAGCINDNSIYCIDISNPANMKKVWTSSDDNVPQYITKVSILPNKDLIISSGITTDLYYWKSSLGNFSPKIAYMYTTKRIGRPPPSLVQKNKPYIYIAVAVLLILFLLRGEIYSMLSNARTRTLVIIFSTAIVIGAGIISIGLSG